MASKTVDKISKWTLITMIVIGFLNSVGFPIRKEVITGVEVFSQTVRQIDEVINSDEPVIDHSWPEEDVETETEIVDESSDLK